MRTEMQMTCMKCRESLLDFNFVHEHEGFMVFDSVCDTCGQMYMIRFGLDDERGSVIFDIEG